jgi:hypothetical protein
MAGFKRDLVYVLDFSARPEFKGLEVRVKPMTMREQLEIATLMDGMTADNPREVMVTLDALLQEFASKIVSWNLEHDDSGEIREISYDTLASLDAAFQQALIEGWTQTLSGVSDDLGKDSPSGTPFPEESLPMETLSAPLLS